MPKMIQIFDEKTGESQWIEGSGVPKGFTVEDPNADNSEDVTEVQEVVEKKPKKTAFKKAES